MKNTVSSEDDNQKKESKLIQFKNWLYGAFGSLNKFRRSSFLSIIMLGVILFLIKGLDQAYTLLVHMVEDDGFSLLLCYIVISVFSLVISHYPIYIYYAKDINDSKDENYWYVYSVLRFYKIFTFAKKDHTIPLEEKYEQDYLAKFFRYSLGLSIYCIWVYYIYKTFEPKLLYAFGKEEVWFSWLSIFFGIVSFTIMGWELHKKQKIERQKEEGLSKAFYKKRIFLFYILTISSAVLLIVLMYRDSFDFWSYIMLQMLTIFLAWRYIYFRICRTKLGLFKKNFFIHKIRFNYFYNLFFLIVAVGILTLLIYCNYIVTNGGSLPNAMVILLGYFYIIYYGLASILKYLFVIQAIKRQSETYDAISSEDERMKFEKAYISKNEFRMESKKIIPLSKQMSLVKKGKNITTIGLVFVLALIIASSMYDESKVHELETFNIQEDNDVLHMTAYSKTLESKIENDKPLFFVASHGGALKANIWTMKLLNHIQEKTNGKFLDQTASFSGASGGMMGLSMYAILSGKYDRNTTNRYKKISDRIDIVAKENYASIDVSYMFGWDFIRKSILVRNINQHKDRAYFSMVAYQNLLECKDKNNRTLDSLSFQSYWKNNIYVPNNYFPAILVNTAKTNGRRGVFSSVRYNQDERDLFVNADNLAQLESITIKNGKKERPVISFYQAISCTNRFPLLSPAAKIKGYGHYIDAGAIDNSGLLTSLDWYARLKNGEDAIIERETNVIFVEIINGKSNYIKHLLEDFRLKYSIDFIQFEEEEQSNLEAVISAGLNLDKNPDYFSDLIKRLEKRGRKKDTTGFSTKKIIANNKKYSVKHIPIYLPRVITLKDVESFVGGEISNRTVQDKNKINIKVRDSLIKFLQIKNKEIYKATEGLSKTYSWETYEPTLARHLSKSTLKYYDKILENSDDVGKKLCQLIEELQIDCTSEE